MSAAGEQRKRLRAVGGRSAQAVAAIAEAMGHEVVQGGPADLLIAEVQSPGELTAALVEAGASHPALVVTRRRLRTLEVAALAEAGARRVLDAESSVLDAMIACSDLLFASRAERRRHGRVHGGIPVRLRALGGDGARALGLLVDLSRAGAQVMTERCLEECAPVEIELRLLGRAVALRGRVACGTGRPAESEGVVIEFAFDDADVAPQLSALLDASSEGLRIGGAELSASLEQAS